MDEKTLELLHSDKNFLAACSKLETQIKEAEALWATLPSLEDITDPDEKYDWIAKHQKLATLKRDLRELRINYSVKCYKEYGLMGIPVPPKQSEPGE